MIANNTVILSTLTDETLNPYDKGELVSKEVNNSLLLGETKRSEKLHDLFQRAGL